jgi:hypothetical protein
MIPFARRAKSEHYLALVVVRVHASTAHAGDVPRGPYPSGVPILSNNAGIRASPNEIERSKPFWCER